MTTVVGDTVGIPDSVMGITFLSAGGNLPEMVSIVILSRQGLYHLSFIAVVATGHYARCARDKITHKKWLYYIY